jgi:glycosyltransferase involved in cell wall biosynthesis
MNQLTVIIPFLNEGQEIGNTLQSIRETAGDQVDILLINDSSHDDFDYKAVAQEYHASYLQNETRLGVARSRDIGVEKIATDYFLIVDGHMRFYHNNWWNVITAAIKQNDRALYCCKCRPLDQEVNHIQGKPSFGAFIEMYNQENLYTLSATWSRSDMYPKQNMVKIPCVFGASYAASKTYWTYLKGLSGLRMYGSDEPYISLKVWLEGGDCILMKNIEIGHIFRKIFPYEVRDTDTIFNKLLIAETLLPPEYKDLVYNILRRTEGIYLRDAMELLTDRMVEVQELKSYYQKITTRSFESFITFNTEVKEKTAAMPE